MNTWEYKMVDLLKELKEKYGAVNVKAEFVAEGTRLEELLRLKEICMVADMGLALKIGGCESIRDMLESKLVGVNYLVAPMVESSYALRKYLQGVNNIFPEDERYDLEILCNIETITACNKINEMLEIPEIGLLNGIVIERVDLCFSMGMDDEHINKEDINQMVEKTLKKAKEKHLTCIIGGGVSADSLPFFRSIKDSIDRYETRKVCFSSKDALNNDAEKGILKALAFELFWLKNKINYYKNISLADKERINLIETKYWNTIDSLM